MGNMNSLDNEQRAIELRTNLIIEMHSTDADFEYNYATGGPYAPDDREVWEHMQWLGRIKTAIQALTSYIGDAMEDKP